MAITEEPLTELKYNAVPCRIDALLGVARSQIKLGKLQEAKATVRAALDMALPDDIETIWAEMAEAHREQGSIYINAAQFDLAASAYTEATSAWLNSGREMDQTACSNDLHMLALSAYRVGLELLDRNSRSEAVGKFDLALGAAELSGRAARRGVDGGADEQVEP